MYAWKIRRKPTYDQNCFFGPMLLAIQRTSPLSRAVLVVDLQVSRPDNVISPHQTAVTPAVVCAVVTRALAEGWRPETGRGRRLVYPLAYDRT